jgi:integrase
MATVAERWQSFFIQNELIIMPSKPPYKAAYLQCPADKSLSKKWFVCFWVWSEKQEKLFRKRMVISGSTVEHRERLAADIIAEVNAHLALGVVMDKLPRRKTMADKTLTVIEALANFIEIKNKTLKYKTRKEYLHDSKKFILFLEHKNISEIPLKDYTVDLANEYMDWLILDQNLSNKSHNKHKGFVSAFFNEYRRREVIVKNPFSEITKLTETIGRYRLFSQSQIAEFKGLTENEEATWFFANFIYYSFLRPHQEARFLLVEDILEKTIIVRSQNDKMGRVRHIQIAPGLEVLLQKYKIRDYPSHYYVFSNKGIVPNDHLVHEKYWYIQHVKFMKTMGIFGKGYDLYGWKHTGAAALYRATKDLKLVQEQCGHTDPKQTAQYLRDLGAFYYEGQIKSFPSI